MFSVKAQHRNNTLQKVLSYRGNIVDSRDFAPTCVESEDLNPAVFIDSLFFNGHGGGLNTWRPIMLILTSSYFKTLRRMHNWAFLIIESLYLDGHGDGLNQYFKYGNFLIWDFTYLYV